MNTRHNGRGYCGIGVYRPKSGVNVGTLWRSAQCLDARLIFTIQERFPEIARTNMHAADPALGQRTDTMCATRHVPYMRFSDVAALRDAFPLVEIVAVELADRAVDLVRFQHPERALYLLGAEDTGIPRAVLAQCDHVVQIDSWRCLNVAATGTVVQYDRNAKRART